MEINNWEKEFDKQFMIFPKDQSVGAEAPEVKAFIRSEIIEKLIEDISDEGPEINRNELLKQLRAKWLGRGSDGK